MLYVVHGIAKSWTWLSNWTELVQNHCSVSSRLPISTTIINAYKLNSPLGTYFINTLAHWWNEEGLQSFISNIIHNSKRLETSQKIHYRQLVMPLWKNLHDTLNRKSKIQNSVQSRWFCNIGTNISGSIHWWGKKQITINIISCVGRVTSHSICFYTFWHLNHTMMYFINF